MLVLAGCDTVSEGNVLLSPRQVTFEFEVDAGELSVGQTAAIDAINGETLQGRLDGFSSSELVAARVTEVRLRRVAPIGSNTDLGDLLQSAQVAVTGGSTQQVASGTGFGAVTQTALAPTGADVASILRQEQFSARLTLTPKRVVSGIYEATLTLALEVEGL